MKNRLRSKFRPIRGPRRIQAFAKKGDARLTRRYSTRQGSIRPRSVRQTRSSEMAGPGNFCLEKRNFAIRGCLKQPDTCDIVTKSRAPGLSALPFPALGLPTFPDDAWRRGIGRSESRPPFNLLPAPLGRPWPARSGCHRDAAVGRRPDDHRSNHRRSRSVSTIPMRGRHLCADDSEEKSSSRRR